MVGWRLRFACRILCTTIQSWLAGAGRQCPTSSRSPVRAGEDAVVFLECVLGKGVSVRIISAVAVPGVILRCKGPVSPGTGNEWESPADGCTGLHRFRGSAPYTERCGGEPNRRYLLGYVGVMWLFKMVETGRRSPGAAARSARPGGARGSAGGRRAAYAAGTEGRECRLL